MPHGKVVELLLEDYDLFQQVRVDATAGTIVWPNSADLSPRMLYEQAGESVPS